MRNLAVDDPVLSFGVDSMAVSGRDGGFILALAR